MDCLPFLDRIDPGQGGSAMVILKWTPDLRQKFKVSKNTESPKS